MKRRYLLVILCVAVLLTVGAYVLVASVGDSADAAAPQQQAENVELVGQIGGSVEAVAVQGNYAYLGVGPRLVILDVSDPAYPAVVGQTEVLFGVVRGVAVAGSYAYVAADWKGGLRIIDISDPAAPTEVGFYQTPWQAMHVAVAGNYAYVVAWASGLHIVDVSDAAAPTEVGFYDTSDYARGVAVAGSYAYVAAEGAGLRIVDVSDPTNPTEAGSSQTVGAAYDVAVAGSYAYVADFASGLHIVDVSDPAAPTEVGFYDIPGAGHGVAVAGNYAYVAAWGSGLRIIDVSDPANPTETGFSQTAGPAYDVAVAGNHAYVDCWNSGLQIIEVSNPSATAEVSFYGAPGPAYDVAVAGNYAYVPDWSTGLRIIDLSNPATPNETGLQALWLADGVAVAGNHAYVTHALNLAIVDVSDPANPTETGVYYAGCDSSDVAVADKYAYIPAGSCGLHIVDVSEPANPTLVGVYDTPANDVAVAINYAYVSTGTGGLDIVDISDPTNPTLVGVYDRSGSDVTVAGNYAYVAAWASGLDIVDVSDPTNPAQAGVYDTPGSARSVAVAGNYAYVGDANALRIVDVTNPAAPTEAGLYEMPPMGSTENVVVAGDYVYVAGADAGLFILRFTGEVEPTDFDFAVEDVWWSPTTPVAMSVSTIYVRIVNVGSAYQPSTGGYTVGVKLTDIDGEPDDYWYYRLGGADTIPVLLPYEAFEFHFLFYFTRPEADLVEVTLFPADIDSNVADNARTKGIIILPAAHTMLDCMSLLVDAVMVVCAAEGVAGELLVDIYTEFVVAAAKAVEAADAGHWDKAWQEFVTFVGKCVLSIAADLATAPVKVAISVVKAVVSYLWDYVQCSHAIGDILTRLVDDLQHRGVDINASYAESPIYVMVTNSSNQRAGFLDDGSEVIEIPDAEVLRASDGRKLILYPGRDTQSVVVTGSAPGDFDLMLAMGKADGSTHYVEYQDVSVWTDTVGTIDATNPAYPLELDDNGDGTIDRVVSPSSITVTWPNTIYLPMIIKND